MTAAASIELAKEVSPKRGICEANKDVFDTKNREHESKMAADDILLGVYNSIPVTHAHQVHTLPADPRPT